MSGAVRKAMTARKGSSWAVWLRNESNEEPLFVDFKGSSAGTFGGLMNH